ncbi:hypothetical protein P3T25_005475 [Paraburkholderia sp. GAS32]
MSYRERSLRALVDKWLGAGTERCIRVVSFNHSRRSTWRYACIEATCASGTFAIFFFRHDDGTWRVFPPERKRPEMHPATMIS